MILNAEKYLKEFGDEFVTVEHLLLAVLDGSDDSARVLKDAGFNKKELIETIKELRGGAKSE